MSVNQESIGEVFREAMAEAGAANKVEQKPDSEEISDEIEQDEDELETQEGEQAAESEAEEAEAEDDNSEKEERQAVTPDQVTINDLAAAFEGDINPADVYKIKVPMKNMEPVTIGELKDAYTASKEIQSEGSRLKEERKQLEEAIKAANQNVANSAQMSDRMLELRAMHYALTQEEQTIDWNKESQQDPGRAAYRKTQLSDARRAVEEEFQRESQKFYQQQNEQYQNWINDQVATAIDKISEWKDPSARKQDVNEILGMLKESYGFTDHELSQLVDHRQILAYRDLMLYKKASEKIKEIPKPKPGLKSISSSASSKVRLAQSGQKLKLKKIQAAESRGRNATDLRGKASAISEILQLIGD